MEQDATAVRPTLRCLSEFLAPELAADAAYAAAARAAVAEDDSYLLPWRLYELVHPALTKARAIVQNEEALKPVESVSEQRLWKVKIGPFRGAIWKDDDGQWWLLGAGRRKDDGSGDFYKEHIDNLGGDASSLLPDELDRRYQRFERAIDTDLAADRAAQLSILDAILSAAADRGTRCEPVRIFGADVSVRVSVDGEVDPPELTVEIEMISYEDQDRIPHDLLALVPFFGAMENWDVIPPTAPDQAPIWWTFVPESWIDWLRVAVELDELLAEGSPAGPPSVPPADATVRSHYAARAVVALAYVEGVAIRGLCGHEFTPSREPEQFERCESCLEALALLRGLREGT